MTNQPPTAPVATGMPPRTSVPLLVASTLCWIWGVLLLLVTLAVVAAFSAFPMNVMVVVALVFLILAAFYITAGVAIRRRKKWGGIVGIAVAAVYASLAGLGMVVGLASPAAAENGTTTTQTLLTGLLGLGLNSAIIVLVIVRWRELE